MNNQYANQAGAQTVAPAPTAMFHTIESLQKASARLSMLTDRAQSVVTAIMGGWPVEADQQPKEGGSDIASILRNVDDVLHRRISQLENAIEMLQTRVLAPQVGQQEGIIGAATLSKRY